MTKKPTFYGEQTKAQAVQEIMNKLIDCIIIWQQSAPDSLDATFNLIAPNGMEFNIDFTRVANH